MGGCAGDLSQPNYIVEIEFEGDDLTFGDWMEFTNSELYHAGSDGSTPGVWQAP